jgi:hypothetical protein
LQYLLRGVEQGEPGLLISFEEFPQSLDDAQSLVVICAFGRIGVAALVFHVTPGAPRSLESPSAR